MLDEKQSFELGMNYGRVFAVLANAIRRTGGRVGDADIDRMFSDPQQEFVLLTKRTFAANALDEDDGDLLAALVSQIPPSWDEEGHDRDQVRCGVGSGYYTPYDMRPAQAAEELGVSKARVSQLVTDGKLDAIRAGKNKVFISGASVRLFAKRVEE